MFILKNYLAGVDGDPASVATGLTAQHALEEARLKQERRRDTRPLTVQKIPPHIIERIFRRGPRIDQRTDGAVDG